MSRAPCERAWKQHAGVIRFLSEHHVKAVVAHHIGDHMVRTLDPAAIGYQLRLLNLFCTTCLTYCCLTY